MGLNQFCFFYSVVMQCALIWSIAPETLINYQIINTVVLTQDDCEDQNIL